MHQLQVFKRFAGKRQSITEEKMFKKLTGDAKSIKLGRTNILTNKRSVYQSNTFYVALNAFS